MASIVPTRLRCNLLVDPLVIADAHPRLSWVLKPVQEGTKNARQTAYRLLVSSQESGKPDLWDSGRVESDQTLAVPYQGKPLEPYQTAYWQVVIWDEKGEESEQGKIAQWTQAPDEWPAKWIGYDAPLRRARPMTLGGAHWIWHEDETPMKSPPGVCYFRVTFDLPEPTEIEILASALSGEGYTVLVASDGDQVIAMVAEFEPDLVIVDLILPRRDGFAVLEAFRAMEGEVAATKAVILSGCSST